MWLVQLVFVRPPHERRILDSIMSFVSDCNFLKSIKTMRNFVALVGWCAHKVCQATTTNNDKDEGDSDRAMAHRKIGYDTSLIMNYKLAFIFKERVITRVFFLFRFCFCSCVDVVWMGEKIQRKLSPEIFGYETCIEMLRVLCIGYFCWRQASAHKKSIATQNGNDKAKRCGA